MNYNFASHKMVSKCKILINTQLMSEMIVGYQTELNLQHIMRSCNNSIVECYILLKNKYTNIPIG